MVTPGINELILYEDDAILVINKPVGLLSLQDGYDKSLPHVSAILAPTYGKLWMVHRLDRDTSGVMVLARSAQAHHQLNDQFRNRQVVKIYHALVYGSPDWDEKELQVNLRKDGDREHRTTIHPKGKDSSTSFQILRRNQDYSLIEARPHTGYTHQIRAHLAYLGHPIVGDYLYGKQKNLEDNSRTGSHLLNRVGLHAWSLTFTHPISLSQVTFTSPYPGDFQDALRSLTL